MTWTVRVREADLTLSDTVNFQELRLQENYNIPDALALDGRLTELYPAMAEGAGIVVTDEYGALRFSGVSAELPRNGNGVTTLSFVGDLINLYDRIVWPAPTQPWEAQNSVYDTQAGSAEDRIRAYIDRNAGPSAYRNGTGPTASPTGAAFTAYQTIVAKSRTTAQLCVQDPDTGDLYLTQGSDSDGPTASGAPDNLIVNRFHAGTWKSSMTIPRGGHGDELALSKKGKTVLLTFRYGSLGGYKPNTGSWVTLPYTAGKVWKAAAVKKLASKGYARSKLARSHWFQGETSYAGVFYRLYGTPYDAAGSTETPAIPARIEVIQNDTVVRNIDASSLGRASGGAPLDAKLEPEGISTIKIAGSPYLLIGVGIGAPGHKSFALYTYPLTAPATPAEEVRTDRRVYGLTLPATSLHRGPSYTNKARFQNLGAYLAAIAETADLRVQVGQAYTTDLTPYLAVTLTSVPDLSDYVRFGDAHSSGPAMLGDGWSYRASSPTGTTILSAASGEGTARKLTQARNTGAEAAWGRRVEFFLDQSGNDDDDDIAKNLTKAVTDNADSVEVIAPVSSTNLDFGTEVPVGATVAAVLDGLVVLERIRRLNTTVNETGMQVEPIFGTPDTTLSASARKVRKQLRRDAALGFQH